MSQILNQQKYHVRKRFTCPWSCLMLLTGLLVIIVKPSRLSKLQYFTGKGPVHGQSGSRFHCIPGHILPKNITDLLCEV